MECVSGSFPSVFSGTSIMEQSPEIFYKNTREPLVPQCNVQRDQYANSRQLTKKRKIS